MSESKPFKVCLVSYWPPPYGGIVHWATMILSYAQKRTDVSLHLVDVATRWRKIDDLTLWKRVAFGGITMIWHLVQVIYRLVGGCKIVHITTPGQLSVFRDIAIIRIARFLGVRSFYHIRFGRIPEISEQGTREWKRISKAMRLSHCVIAIDKATESAIRKHWPQVNLVRIPNCVDLSCLPAISHSENGISTLLYLGWVVPTKGIEELVKAWSDLQPEGWQLHIVGPGDKVYQAQLQDQYPPSNIIFTGEKSHDEVMKMLAGADILVLPSHTEGFPNVILEAMALRKPVIATRVGAIPEMLSDDCGLLVEPKDVASLKGALSLLMEDHELCDRMGNNGYERVITQYSIEVVFSQYSKLWKQVT